MKIKKEFKINPFSTKKLNFMAALFVCFSLLAIAMVPITQKGLDATKTDDTTSYVMVDEIWNAEEGYFNANTLSSLLQYITNNASITSSDITTAGSIGQTKSSADIRASTANGKTTSQDVQVTFGGLTWQVVYLSQDRSGNDIITLWLSSNKQDAWAGRSATEGAYYGFIDGALYSDWSADRSNLSTSGSYPSNMYGTSYINAVTLNNGGIYATSMTATAGVEGGGQSANSVFAMFTMDSVAGSVTDYLVTPRQVAYQEDENAVEDISNGWTSYWTKNDAYGEITGSGGWHSSSHDYTSKTGYTNWADNYLWLPSVTETGTSSTYVGIWDTSSSQRANNSGSTSEKNTGVGTSNSNYGTYVRNYSWLRSGYYHAANYAYLLDPSGGSYVYSPAYYDVSNSYAVRPALHLNLNSAASSDPTIWDGTSTEQPTLQNPAQANSEDNPYIIDSAAKLAWISANFDQSNCYGQHYLQTVDINLNNHPWTPINNASSRRAYFYDGGGHTISNLYINTSEQTLASNNYLGLFGYVFGSSSNHAYIKNLGIVNGSIAGESSRYVGAVVGYSYYTDITNCYNEKTDITMTGSSEYVGGVAGSSEYGTISSSYNTGTVSGFDYSVGVVTGYNGGTISGSYNTGTVTGSGNYVGGVVGLNYGTISGSYNTGTVSGVEQVGGVVGESRGTISGSYNTGTVSGVEQVGGVVGLNFETISSSYNDGDITGSSSEVGGVVGYNQGTISSSYNTGTVSGDMGVGGVAGVNVSGTISSSYNTGTVSGSSEVGGVVGYVNGSSFSPAVISSCFSTGAVTRTSGSSTYFGGVVGDIYNNTSYPSQYVSISWCYYNTETVGGVVTKAIGSGNGYQCYGLTTAQMQGDKNQNYMYLSDTVWNFASGSYPTLKYVATAQN